MWSRVPSSQRLWTTPLTSFRWETRETWENSMRFSYQGYRMLLKQHRTPNLKWVLLLFRRLKLWMSTRVKALSVVRLHLVGMKSNLLLQMWKTTGSMKSRRYSLEGRLNSNSLLTHPPNSQLSKSSTPSSSISCWTCRSNTISTLPGSKTTEEWSMTMRSLWASPE